MPPLQPPPLPSLPLLPTLTPPPPPPPHHHHHYHPTLLLPLSIAITLFSFLLFLFILYRKLSNKRTTPVDLKPPSPPHSFSYSVLKRATSSFSAENRVGQGGFGSVYKGTLPCGLDVAVKVMDSEGSIQGEREFQNELSLASRIETSICPHVVSVLGYCTGDCRRRRRLLLVYEFMEKGSLQDALLHKKCVELMNWNTRFRIIKSVAKGVEYLHHFCDPPIVHGDIKPSNVLLDLNFNARIADFGLAQVLSKDEGIEEEGRNEEGRAFEDGGSIVEGNECVIAEEVVVNLDQSPNSFVVRVGDVDSDVMEPSPSERLEKSSVLDKSSISEGVCDVISTDSGYHKKGIGRRKSESGRDWWWKQEATNAGSESGRIKDYVMEWLGSEIKKGPRKDCSIASTSTHGNKVELKKKRRKFEWWMSMDDEKVKKDKKNRKPREWWKEEFCEELSKKKKKRGSNSGEMWWQRDDDVPSKKKRKNWGSKSSIDWWLDGFSGEFRIGRRNSQDWASGDIPKSGGISSTPSMRGTVCYIAPEYGCGGQLSEKCDVYSFGVLLLVLVSGRRPLQVTASPMSEFERANLVSWARQLGRNGKLLDLVDPNIQGLDRQQALLCITIGLLCLQRSPNKRPSMKDIVGMLSGESETPHLPFEFSPSPPSNFPFKSRKKGP